MAQMCITLKKKGRIMVDEIKKVAWNLSAQLLYEIGNLLQGASAIYVNGNTMKAFHYLQAVKMRINHSLDGNERKKFARVEAKMGDAFMGYNNENEVDTDHDKRKKMWQNMSAIYFWYNELIMDALEKYGYLIEEKKDPSTLNVRIDDENEN